MFIAGSILMTIDPPMFLCWALATYFAALAIFDNRGWGWPLVGIAMGLGFLAKYAAPLWYLGLLVFLLVDGSLAKHFRGLTFAFLITAVFTIPVMVWNAQHGWVSLHHVAHQTGASGGSLKHGNFLELIASQIGVIGPILAAFMIGAIVYLRHANEVRRAQLLFLASIGLTFLALTLLISFLTKVQVNWPAPAYFTLFILTAYFIATRLRSRALWRRWRMWFWGTVAMALVATPILHDTSLLFWPVLKINSMLGTRIDPAKVDLLNKLRGWQILGDHLSAQLEKNPDAIILADDYMQAAEAAFYTKGQPKTYYAGSYYAEAKRFTQYDMWPDRALDRPELKGKTVIFVGKGGAFPADIEKAFERVEPLPDVDIVIRGVKVRTFRTWIGRNFKGMTRPNGPSSF
jgi:undecaprenyl-diphosphatase